MEPLISIIIPAYNAEHYLEQCLDSLIHQTYGKIEIICVNDGSIDGTGRILQDYEKKDSRIRIINKKNKGVSEARNSALRLAQGQYLMFVDSDDWIEADTCEIVIEKVLETGADAVFWPYISEHESTSISKRIFDRDMEFDELSVKEKIHRRMIGLVEDELEHPENADCLCTVWGKLYKAEIIKQTGLKFIDLQEIGTYEDGLFNLYYFEHVKKAEYVNQYLYHYRRTNNSSLTTKYNKYLFIQWQNLFDIMQRYIVEKKLDSVYEIALKNRIALSLLGLGLNIMVADINLKKKFIMLKNILDSERYKEAYANLKFQYFPIHWKVFYRCAKYNNIVGILVLLAVIRKIIYR